jgi:hypothetical protein
MAVASITSGDGIGMWKGIVGYDMVVRCSLGSKVVQYHLVGDQQFFGELGGVTS